MRLLSLLALIPALAFGQVRTSSGIPPTGGTFSGPVLAPSFTATVASGNNGLACQQNGCRVDFGAGASDYASSDGSTVTFAGPVGATSVTTSAASGAAAISVVSGSKICLDATCTRYLAQASSLMNAISATSFGGLNVSANITGGGGDGATAVGMVVKSFNTLSTAGAKIATFAPDNANTVKASIDKDGTYSMDGTDASGTPGAATINQPIGQVSVDDTASSVVVTNSLVTAASVVIPVLQFVDATCTHILSCVPGAGSFTITMNAACTAHTKIGFVVHNYF